MIPNPDTLARIREQADGHVALSMESMFFGPRDFAMVKMAIRRAYLAGADAGYTAALTERREK